MALDLNLKHHNGMKKEITWTDFSKVDIRVGTILSATVFKEAIKPAYQLSIDFGTLGIKKSSAQITERYTTEDLIGKQVVAVVNFPPKQIANFMSECLILGAVNGTDVILIHPESETENGLKIG